MEVCPLAREGILHPLSAPLQGGLRFLHLPLPAPPSASLASRFPGRCRERDGFTVFRVSNKDGSGSLYPPVALGAHDKGYRSPCSRYIACLAQACQHL